MELSQSSESIIGLGHLQGNKELCTAEARALTYSCTLCVFIGVFVCLCVYVCGCLPVCVCVYLIASVYVCKCVRDRWCFIQHLSGKQENDLSTHEGEESPAGLNH